MRRVEEIADDIAEAMSQLSRANRLTGIWDNRRFEECKKPQEQVDPAYLYLTEKLSRKNVELRAKYRTQIDVLFEELLEVRQANPDMALK